MKKVSQELDFHTLSIFFLTHVDNIKDVMFRIEYLIVCIARRFFMFQDIAFQSISDLSRTLRGKKGEIGEISNERGDVPGWVLVVLMTAGLVTGIWTVAAPRLNQILRNSLDSMNAIR